MRRSGAWMQLCSKLGARARCGWSAPHIMPVSDIFLDAFRFCRSVRLARRLTLFTKLFSGLDQPEIWIKALLVQGLCLIQPREGRIASPVFMAPRPIKTTGLLGFKGEQNETL